MKTVKVVLFAVAGVVVVAIVGLAILVASFDPNKFKPEIALAVKDKTGRTLAMDGNIGLSLFPDLGVAVAKVSLSEPDSSRIFARIDNARVSLALLPLLSRQVVIDKVSLSGVSADLVKHKDGKTNFEDLVGHAAGAPATPRREAKAPPATAPRLEIAGIEVRTSSIGWNDEASGARYKVSIAEFSTGRIASGVPGKLSLAARIEATQPKTDLQLRLASSYRFDLERKTVAISGLELDLTEGAGGLMPATSIRGDAEYDLSSQAMRFNLGIDRLNLDRYLPPPAKGAAAGGGAPAQPSEQPVDLSALKGLKVQGSVKVGELIVSNVKTEKIDVGVQASGGRMEIKPLSARLYRGSFSGDATLDANGNHVALKGKLDGVAVGPLLKDALANDLLEGSGNMDLDVQTSGATVLAMKKALSGSAGLSLRDAALKGINLDEAARKARALAGAKPAAEPAAGSAERTDFTEITATFVIRGGVAHNEDLSARSPLLRVSGSGNVDIGGNAIDYLAKVSVVATSSGQGGADAESLRGLTVPVKISGPLEAPKFHADLGSAAGEAVKQRAEERLKDEVKDRLKGLLRR